ncbi:hypothetical protein AAC387_Pa03g4044 [Persea americana]
MVKKSVDSLNLEEHDMLNPFNPNAWDWGNLDDNFLQFGQPDFQTDHFSQSNPPQYDSNNDSDSFLLDLSNFNADPTTESSPYNSLLPEISTVAEAHSTNSAALIEGADSGCFLNDQLCLPAPGESHESFFDHVLGSIWTPATTSTSEVNPVTLDTTNLGPIQNQEDEQEEDYQTCDDWKPGALNCKSLVSERNRRKRLNQQLLALRALVPNTTKMDRRSVLGDALAYLKSIHEATAQTQAELKWRSSSSSSSSFRYNHSSLQPPPVHKNSEALVSTQMLAPLPPRSSFKQKAHILERRSRIGGPSNISSPCIYVLTTVFIKVRKQRRMTEERLKSSITSTALRSGLKLQNP